MNDFQIGDIQIGPGHKPFIIAEMSGNHNQSLERALEIVDAAAASGADAVKLQTYTADTMTLKCDREDFWIRDENSLWADRHLYDLYEEAHTPWDWHQPIMERAKEKGLLCFSSPFDFTAVDFLEELDVPAYKIASFENTDVRLIRKVAATGKPIIVSTGMATLEDIELIVTTLTDAGCKQFVLLKCTSAYPANAETANIRTIPDMAERFGCQVGLSDHTKGIGVAVSSVVLGATVIEKHFCLSRALGGPDAGFSLEPHELESLVIETERAWKSLGSVTYQSSAQEEKSKQFKRSIYFVQDMTAGDVITEENIRCIRPGYGLAPRFFDDLLGKTVVQDISEGEPVSWAQVVAGDPK